MNRIVAFFMRRLSVRLGLTIVLLVAAIFIISVGFLFGLSKKSVLAEAQGRANLLLDNTALRISDIMSEAESATDNMAWYIAGHTDPETLIRDTREILQNNPHFHSCSISMEPYYFKSNGKYFSIYSVRDGDSISTAQYGSDEFQYFNLDWYQNPKRLKQGCWIDPYVNANPKADYQQEIITSYTRPIYDAEGTFIGVVAIDLLQKWLSQTVTAVAPYPNSSAIVCGREGHYFVHPDTMKLIRQTIFSDPDPEARQDVIPLGEDMIAGKSGSRELMVDGNDAYVFFRPLGKAGWSMAIVCPADDVFGGYNRLLYTVWAIIAVGLLVILIFCYQTIRGVVSPLKLLAGQARDISKGQYDNFLPSTSRSDTIGQLQNAFVGMQQSLSAYVGDIRRLNEELEQRNDELTRANEQALEADRKKTAFLQDMMHQIRTPLNIIGGFSQVLEENLHELPDDEAANIIRMMQDASRRIVRIVRMLVASSAVDGQQTVSRESFSCNVLCREIVRAFRLTSPHTVKLRFETEVPDDLMIHSDKEKVTEILNELLENANKFTQLGTIILTCSQPDWQTVTFTVSDTGIGIAEADRPKIFSQFVKVDYFTDGVGLGLTLSLRMARLLGGDLELDPDYHDGASFILRLPLNYSSVTTS
jgi:signal transduction histidine kinase